MPSNSGSNNFNFLTTEYPLLANLCQAAEYNLYEDPNTSLYKLRLYGEKMTALLFDIHSIQRPYNDTFHNRINGLKHELKRYHTENQATPKRPSINESDEADLLDNFDTIKILLSTLGHPIFEETRELDESKKKIYYCKGKDAFATGEYKEDGFVVFAGSKANLNETPTAGNWVKSLRTKLKNSNKLIEKDGVLIFQSDHVFKSPSGSAAAVLGRESNGWLSWKNDGGKTLDEMERKKG